MRAPAPRWERLGFRPFVADAEPRSLEGPVRRIRPADAGQRRTPDRRPDSWLSACTCPGACLRDHDRD